MLSQREHLTQKYVRMCEIRLHLFFQREELDKLYRTVEVEVRGNDPAVLKSYSWFATTAAAELGITVGQW